MRKNFELVVIVLVIIVMGLIGAVGMNDNRPQPIVDPDNIVQTRIVIEIFHFYTIVTENDAVTEVWVDNIHYDITCDAVKQDDNGHNCVLAGNSIPPFLDAVRLGKIPLLEKTPEPEKPYRRNMA